LSGPASLRLTLFAANAGLQPGQEVLTYASVNDRPEVPGVPVGKVVQVTGDGGSLGLTALVQPFVNFTALGVVGIVVQVPQHNPRVAILPRPVPTVTVTVTPTPTPTASAAVSSAPSPSPPATGGG
jgi:rod shape-determining protein MreC